MEKTILPRQWVDIPKYQEDGTVDPDDLYWRVDMTFMMSTYRCTYGSGCKGTGKSNHGCCDNPAFLDMDQVRRLQPYVDRLNDRKRYGKWYVKFSEDNVRTAVRGEHCIFLDPDGCALHKASLVHGEDYRDGKPEICWQVPIFIEHTDDASYITNWEDEDWWGKNDWLCTAEPDNYRTNGVANQYAYQTLEPELRRIMGDKAFQLLLGSCEKQARLLGGTLREGNPVAVFLSKKVEAGKL